MASMSVAGVSMLAVLHWRGICVWADSVNVNPSTVHKISSWETEGPYKRCLKSKVQDLDFLFLFWSPPPFFNFVVITWSYTWAMSNRHLNQRAALLLRHLVLLEYSETWPCSMKTEKWLSCGLKEGKQLSGQAEEIWDVLLQSWGWLENGRQDRMGLVTRRNGTSKHLEVWAVLETGDCQEYAPVRLSRSFRVGFFCGGSSWPVTCQHFSLTL